MKVALVSFPRHTQNSKCNDEELLSSPRVLAATQFPGKPQIAEGSKTLLCDGGTLPFPKEFDLSPLSLDPDSKSWAPVVEGRDVAVSKDRLELCQLTETFFPNNCMGIPYKTNAFKQPDTIAGHG